MLSDYDDTSTELVLETPSGLPENVRHALNVLSVLKIKDDAMFMALINDCLNADPLHLCRMAQKGLFNDIPEIQTQKMAFSGTELHIPFGAEELPRREVVISLRDNAIIGVYFDNEADQFQYISTVPIFDVQILSYLTSRGGDDGVKRSEALVDLINGLQTLAGLCYIAQSALEEPETLFQQTVALIDAGGEG